jgi:CRP-like cAMP-binding protein
MFSRKKIDSTPTIDPELYKKFYPLNEIDSKHHEKLGKKVRLEIIEPNGLIIRKNRNINAQHFLVTGSIEIRESFEHRTQCDSEDPRCAKSLEHGLAERSTIKALSECVVLVADSQHVEQMLSLNQNYTIHHLDDGKLPLPDTAIIDDSFQEDWDNVFIQSPLAANLSHTAIHQLFSSFEEVTVDEGETIVKQNSPGDYFYIIKQGYAEVKTDPYGAYKGESFTLTAGNYFGDEALVAGTIRNSTVTMMSDGVLGRLSHETFNSLIREQLVTATGDQSLLSDGKTRIIDVRFPLEYRNNHHEGSLNIPISKLRKQLGELHSSYRYLVTPVNDCRSELATYLMRQAGLEAYYLHN